MREDLTLPPELEADICRFIDSVGLLQNKETPPGTVASGNGVLTTALTVVLLKLAGKLEPYRDCFTQALEACEREPGLLMRHPLWPEDQESSDDYVAASAASYFLGIELAKRILDRGRHKFTLWMGVIPLPFYLKNEKMKDPKFESRAWIGRFIATTASLQFADREAPGIIDQLLHLVSIGFMPWKNEDEPTLSWLLIKTSEEESGLVRLVSAWFYYRLKKKYPRGMAEVFEKTYGAAHPIPRLALLAGV